MKPGEVLAQLGKGDLVSISNALRSRRLSPPFFPASVSRITGSQTASAVASALQMVVDSGLGSENLAVSIDLLVDALEKRGLIEDFAQLVMTAPTESGAYHRDTRVVVADLFRRAERSITLAGYAVHQGKRIFEDLATRMQSIPSLHVQLFLHLAVRPEDASRAATLARFAEEFRTRHWPDAHPLPELYYDCRTLEAPGGSSIAFHAKCVILDEKELFLSSANFTEAAQNRNVELGVLLISPSLARQAKTFLSELVKDGICKRAI